MYFTLNKHTKFVGLALEQGQGISGISTYWVSSRVGHPHCQQAVQSSSHA